MTNKTSFISNTGRCPLLRPAVTMRMGCLIDKPILERDGEFAYEVADLERHIDFFTRVKIGPVKSIGIIDQPAILADAV